MLEVITKTAPVGNNAETLDLNLAAAAYPPALEEITGSLTKPAAALADRRAPDTVVTDRSPSARQASAETYRKSPEQHFEDVSVMAVHGMAKAVGKIKAKADGISFRRHSAEPVTFATFEQAMEARRAVIQFAGDRHPLAGSKPAIKGDDSEKRSNLMGAMSTLGSDGRLAPVAFGGRDARLLRGSLIKAAEQSKSASMVVSELRLDTVAQPVRDPRPNAAIRLAGLVSHVIHPLSHHKNPLLH